MTFTPNWSKQIYVKSDVAKELSELYEIGFDQAWTQDGYTCFHNYGRRLNGFPEPGKCRIHQDSIEKYESLLGE